MNIPKHHLFVCASFRANGEAQGVCHKKDAISLLSYLQNEIQDRMMEGIEVCVTGCMNQCTKGPVIVDYPSGHTYGRITQQAIDDILDAFEEDRVAEEYLVS